MVLPAELKPLNMGQLSFPAGISAGAGADAVTSTDTESPSGTRAGMAAGGEEG